MYNHISQFNDITNTYSVIMRIFSIGIIVSSFEYIYNIDSFSNNGLYSWRVYSLTPTYLNSIFPKTIFKHLFEKRGVLVFLILRILSSICLIFLPSPLLILACITIIALTSLFISFRNIVGNDGSDQMNSVICITLFVSNIFDNDLIMSAGLYFISAQSILAYFAAGFAKILSYKWRSGSAVFEIMNTRTYGFNKIAIFLRKSPKFFNLIINWNIILAECFFFLVILLPIPFALLFIVWGVLFHLYNAIFMGLNSFFWAFLATYPALIWLHNQINYIY